MFDVNEKYELRIKNVADVNMSNWQITNLLNTMMIVNNKFDVLSKIVDLMEKGIEKKNIFVTDKSFLFTTNYKTYFEKGNLFEIEDIGKMSYIGKLIPMEKNDDLLKINYLFAYSKKINSILNQNLKCRLNKICLIEAYKVLFLDEMDIAYEILKDGARKQIIDAFERYLNPDNKKRDSILEQLEQNKKRFIKKYRTEYNRIDINYKRQFEHYFNRNERPIVGVYNPDDYSITIINFDQMYKYGEEAGNQIRLKSITKNSPVAIALGVSGTMLLFLIYLVCREHKVSNSYLEENMIDLPQDNNTAISNILASKGQSILQTEEYKSIDNQVSELATENLRKLEKITQHKFVELELKLEE